MTKRWLMIIAIVVVLCTSSAALAQPDRATVLAGGNYVLTTQSDVLTQSPGYRSAMARQRSILRRAVVARRIALRYALVRVDANGIG